jgi:FlaG/FlaF family flagellin (archaellin)
VTRDRAATPVVGKTLEVALLVLLAALLTTALFGGVVPAYRTAAGAELADRTLARSAGTVERATPVDPAAWDGLDRTVRASLPDRIGGERYAVRADDGALRLDHPRAGVGGSVRPALPEGATLAGAWRSDRPARVRVRADAAGVRVRLVAGGDG